MMVSRWTGWCEGAVTIGELGHLNQRHKGLGEKEFLN